MKFIAYPLTVLAYTLALYIGHVVLSDWVRFFS